MIVSCVVPAPDPIERLQRFARFVALVAEQLEAIREDDADRLRRLREEAQGLERELLGDTPHGTSDSPTCDDLTPEIREVTALASLQDDLENALSSLEKRFDAERWTEEQLTLLSNGAIRSARSMPLVKLAGCAYPDLEERESHLDRRF